MSLTIFAHQSAAVYAKNNRKILEGNIVNYLVVGALNEGGINITKRDNPLSCKGCRKGYGMLLGNSHIKRPVGHFFKQQVHGASCGHSRCNSYYFIIHFGQLN